MPKKHPTLMLSCMKNEGATVLEWFAYHRVIGIDHFLIYTNDCKDGTDQIWMRLQEMGYATHRNNKPLKRRLKTKPQQRALFRVVEDEVYKDSEWVLFLDADEFLNIHTGDGHIQRLLEINTEADCYLIHWRLFGTSNKVQREMGLVTEKYLMACSTEKAPNRHAVAPKSIFRPEKFSKPGIHRPSVSPDIPDAVHCLASGKVLERNWRNVTQNAEYTHAQVNHYSVQSLEGVLSKFKRGFAVATAADSAQEYLSWRDTNDVEDRTILRHLPAVKAEIARLLEDPVLARLQYRAERWHMRKTAKAMQAPESQEALATLQAALKPLPLAGE